MILGMNKVILAGYCEQEVAYHTTGGGTQCASFRIICERRGMKPKETVTAVVKVNVYSAAMVELLKSRFVLSGYMLVEGELMTREGARGETIEVRAKELIFVDELDQS